VNINWKPGWWVTVRPDRLNLLNTLDWTIVGSLTLLVVLGFGFRLNQLNAIGFAEDEMNKLDAVHQYEQRNFAANAEHPMVMKFLVLLSLHAFPEVSEETALRLPNVIVGGLTAIPLFLLMA